VLGSWQLRGTAALELSTDRGVPGEFTAFSQEWRLPPPTFTMEGPYISIGMAPEAGWPLRLPSPLDAAVTGAAVHRLSCIYTNLANAMHLQHCFENLRPAEARELAALLGAAQRRHALFWPRRTRRLTFRAGPGWRCHRPRSRTRRLWRGPVDPPAVRERVAAPLVAAPLGVAGMETPACFR
jgi:hypothetical protein